MSLRNGLFCASFLSLFQHTIQQTTQTLTKANAGNIINDVRLEKLSNNVEDTDTGWELDVVSNNADDWSLWIQTQAGSVWGLHPNLSSSFTLELSGSTSTNAADLLIAIGDGNDAKSFVILIGLNGHTPISIAPGCDNIISPTQLLNSGDVYYTLSTLTSEPRQCRPAYLDPSNTCPYTVFGPTSIPIIWPITFILNNYPNQGYSTITFKANGYNPIKCGFGEAFASNVGLNVYITTLQNDRFIISKMDLSYELITTTQIPSVSPTTTQPSISPSESPITQQPSLSPSDVPTTSLPSSQPSSQPSINPTVSTPTVSPSTNPSINPSTLIPTTLIPTHLPSMNPSEKPSISPSDNPTLQPTLSPSLNPSKLPSNNPTIEPTFRINQELMGLKRFMSILFSLLKKNFKNSVQKYSEKQSLYGPQKI